MDRPLDDMISERQHQRPKPRGRRPARNDERPRPAPKTFPRDNIRDLDKDDWVHDRYEGDRYEDDRYASREVRPPRDRRIEAAGRQDRDDSAIPSNGARLRVDNLHYDLTEPDLRELFTRIGPVHTVSILYDRSDRSRGTAFVTYLSARDADEAMKEFDGANAYGQPIKLTLMPSGPTGKGLDSRIEAPGRSLFDRIQNDSSVGVGKRGRSDSPPRSRRSEVLREGTPDGIDRYVPGSSTSRRPRSRSPIRSRNPKPPRGATNSGTNRDDRRRGGRSRGSNTRDPDSRPTAGARPRKTAQELDAEMADYWGSGDAAAQQPFATDPQAQSSGANGANIPAPAIDDDIDMIE